MGCCDITAGMLKEPVTFERQSQVSDGVGGYTYSWAAISGAPTRAMVKAMSGSERYASQRAEATAHIKVTTRYFSDLKEADSVVIRGIRHNVRFIDNVDFEDRWLVISVERGVAV